MSIKSLALGKKNEISIVYVRSWRRLYSKPLKEESKPMILENQEVGF